MIWLVGALACAPHVRLAWSTSPEVAANQQLTYAVVGKGAAGPLGEALRATVARTRRLRHSCADGADAFIEVTAAQTESRVVRSVAEGSAVTFVLPGGQSTAPLVAEARSVTQWRGRVHLGWRVARCDGTTLESVPQATVAGTREADEIDTVQADSWLADLVTASGQSLARRLVPTSGRVSRRWFASGDPRLRLAAKAVRVGHWDAAAVTWTTILLDSSVSERVRARAHTDLAVFHEVHGRTAQALRSVARAERATALPAVRRYRQELERIWADSEKPRPYAPLDAEEEAGP